MLTKVWCYTVSLNFLMSLFRVVLQVSPCFFTLAHGCWIVDLSLHPCGGYRWGISNKYRSDTHSQALDQVILTKRSTWHIEISSLTPCKAYSQWLTSMIARTPGTSTCTRRTRSAQKAIGRLGKWLILPHQPSLLIWQASASCLPGWIMQ